jgi:PhoP regulatory network protein YrbL
MMNVDIKALELVGEGERSKVYAHPTDSDKVIKVTKYKAEKELIRWLFENNNPFDYFVKIHEVWTKGHYLFAVIERVPEVDLAFRDKEGRRFKENRFRGFTFREAVGGYYEEMYIQEQISKLDADESDVRAYYALLKQADRNGLDLFDVAWNMGRRADGSLVCYDAGWR